MSRPQDLTLDIAATTPAVSLMAFRVVAALAIGLLWGAPTWLLVLTSALALAATGAWMPMMALAFGAIAGWLPERFVDGAMTVSASWWATLALIIVLAHALIISARLTERVGPRARVEWRAIAHLVRRSVPGQLVAQAIWGAACLLPLIVTSPPAILLTIGAGALAALAVLIIVSQRRT